jgi:D-alanyl-D-alanine carboxypeptidase
MIQLAALLAGCGWAATAAPQPTQPAAAVVAAPPSATIAPSATSAATSTSEPSPTSAATATSEPSPTSAATATSEPSPTGVLAPSIVVAEATIPPTQAPPEALPATEPATAEPTPAGEAPPIDPALAARLQRILDQTVADGLIPGAVVAVILPGNQTWSGASGVADRSRRIAITPDTHMRIASISKIYTAVVILQLAEEGRLDLDAPLSTWFPDLVPNAGAIRVRSLLNHTSGLYDYLEDQNFVALAYGDPGRSWQPYELVDYASQFPPLFPPGSRDSWDYSSTNYVILGMIAQEVTGTPLAQQMRQRIFEPLGLDQTFFAPDEPVPEPYSRGYARAGEQTNVSMTTVFATANVVSTEENVARFGRALFEGRLLSPAMMEQMYGFVNGKGQYNMPYLAYGLGIMRNVLPVGPAPGGQPRPALASTVMGHIGGFGGFRSALWHAPASGVTIALGVNMFSTDPNILATRVMDAVLTHQGR